MGKKTGICQLCKEEKKFIKAHIIPKTLFKSLFRDYGKVHYVNVQDFETKNKVQDAFFDDALLCVTCDNSFSPFEDYFTKLVNGRLTEIGVNISQKQFYPPGYAIDVYDGVDCNSLRMFLLIMIWRCSISKQQAFREVALGINEAWIEQQIKKGEPDSFDMLPVILISLQDVDDIRKDTATIPMKGVFGDTPVIMFLITGWVIVYSMDGYKIPFFKYRLQQDNQLNVIRLSEEEGQTLLDKITHNTVRIRRSDIIKS